MAERVDPSSEMTTRQVIGRSQRVRVHFSGVCRAEEVEPMRVSSERTLSCLWRRLAPLANVLPPPLLILQQNVRMQRVIFLADARPLSFENSNDLDADTWLSLALLGIADKLRQLLLSTAPFECAVCVYAEDGSVWDLLHEGEHKGPERSLAVQSVDASALSKLDVAKGAHRWWQSRQR